MELGGAPLLFLDRSQALPDDRHPVLLRDCEPLFLFDDEHRSILSDYKGLGVPSIVLQIILQSYVGRALQGFTSSAFVPNTRALPIPNAGLAYSSNC